MGLFLRLLLLLVTAPFRSRCEPLGPARKRFLVLPTDLDLLGHVNNGVYLSMLDVARVDLMMRSGAFARLRSRGYFAVVAAETIRFRRSLRLFQRFEVETRVLGWDEKAFVLQHRFLRGEELVAEAFIRSRFLERGGKPIGTAAVLEALGNTGPSPELPPWIAAWNRENGR